MFDSILQAVFGTEKEAPERLCIVDEEEWSYGRFKRLILAAVRALIGSGIKKGDFVMAECTQDARFMAVNLACGAAGAVFVPLEKKAAAGRVLEIGGEVNASLLISREAYDVPFPAVRFMELLPDGCEQQEDLANEEEHVTMPSPEELCEVMFTTGTTGKSKGIEITFLNNVANAMNVSEGVGIKSGNLELVPVPINHAHGLRTTYANLLSGGGVILTDGVMKAKAILEKMKKYGCNAMDATPTAMSVLLRISKGRFREVADQLTYVELGAEPLTEDLKEKLRETFPGVLLYNAYGSTESGRTCHLEFSDPAKNREYCIGRPTSLASFIVTDDERRPIRSDASNTGLLAVKGPMNTAGYWKNPSLSREVLSEDGFLYTSDEGYIDEEGLIYVLGRRDDVINYQGIKIAPDEIEAAALGFDQVRDCCCVPKSDPVAGQVPRLFVVPEDEDSFDKAALLSYLSHHIDPNRMPHEVVLTDSVPRAYNGKLQRKKLMQI